VSRVISSGKTNVYGTKSQAKKIYFAFVSTQVPIPVTVLFKSEVSGCSIDVTLGSNPAGFMDVHLVCLLCDV
jgi:hypothetical protein